MFKLPTIESYSTTKIGLAAITILARLEKTCISLMSEKGIPERLFLKNDGTKFYDFINPISKRCCCENWIIFNYGKVILVSKVFSTKD